MHAATASTASNRAPDNELYDRGCDLVEAATAIRRLAGDPRAARAVTAVLGCIDTTLHELNGACAALEATTDSTIRARARTRANPRIGAMVERMRRGFANLQRALLDAEDAATAARALAARSLAAPAAGGPEPTGRGAHSFDHDSRR